MNEIMSEQSHDANMELGAVELGENQVIEVNVELQDGSGLQAVGGIHTSKVDEVQVEMMQVVDEGVQDKDLELVLDDGTQAEVIQKTDEVKADDLFMAQVTDKGLQDKEVMLVANDGAQADTMMHVAKKAQTEVMLVLAGEGMTAEDVTHRDGILCMDKIPYQVEDQELHEVCILL